MPGEFDACFTDPGHNGAGPFVGLEQTAHGHRSSIPKLLTAALVDSIIADDGKTPRPRGKIEEDAIAFRRLMHPELEKLPPRLGHRIPRRVPGHEYADFPGCSGFRLPDGRNDGLILQPFFKIVWMHDWPFSPRTRSSTASRVASAAAESPRIGSTTSAISSASATDPNPAPASSDRAVARVPPPPSLLASVDQENEGENPKAKHERDKDAFAALSSVSDGRSRSLIFAPDRRHDRVSAGSYSSIVIVVPESRLNLIPNDPPRQRVGQHSFKTSSDFDPQTSIVDKNRQQHTVVCSCLPNLPGPKDGMDVLFQRHIRRKLAFNPDNDLRGGIALKLREPQGEFGARRRLKNPRPIGNERIRGRRQLLCHRHLEPQKQPGEQRQPGSARERGVTHFAGLPKLNSTDGAFWAAASD